MGNIVVLIWRPKYLAEEVGGWSNIRDMRLSVGVIYDAAEELTATTPRTRQRT